MTCKSMTNNHWRQSRERTKGHIMTGVVIATAGFAWLANNADWFPDASGGPTIFWPSVIIVAGITIVLATRRHRKSEGADHLTTRTENLGQRR